MSPQGITRLVGVAVIIFAVLIMAAAGSYVVDPGFRGVQVTLGKVSPDFKPEGFGLKPPFVSSIEKISIRQRTVSMRSTCISRDLQTVETQLQVLYRVPEGSVVEIFQKYKGDPFTSLISPRVDEAMKEVTKEHTAQEIVQDRAEVKTRALAAAREKIGSILEVVDVVMEDVSLSAKLEAAIERKMVQEQEANRAVFQQQQSQVEAETAVIRARGEAEAIEIRGQALASNPTFIELEIVESWNGITPRVVGGGVAGTDMILPIGRETPKPVATSQTSD